MNKNKNLSIQDFNDRVDILRLHSLSLTKKRINTSGKIEECINYDALDELDQIETHLGMFDKAIGY